MKGIETFKKAFKKNILCIFFMGTRSTYPFPSYHHQNNYSIPTNNAIL